MLSYNEFILERKVNQLESIDEGVKEIALSLLFLTGVITTKGQYAKVIDNPTQGFVDNVESFIKNKDNVNKIWNIIEDEDKFKNKEEFQQKLITSVEQLKERSDDIGDKKTKFKEAKVNIKDTTQISKLIKQGFSPEQFLVTKDTIIKDSVVTKNFEFSPEYNTDIIFKTGTSDLTDEFKNNIKQTIEKLLNRKDGKVEIYEIQIKTSTDKEPISIGNKKLSENRANSVKDYLSSIISTDIKTTDDNGNSLILYDQGPDIYSSEMTNDERKLAREKTKEFRYAEITIKYKLVKEGEQPYTYKELVENEELVLIKITQESKSNLSDKKPNPRIKNKNRSKIKIGKVITDCVY